MAILTTTLIIFLLTSTESLKVYDLTHRLTSVMPNLFINMPLFEQDRLINQPPTFNIKTRAFCVREDAGTHVNAPYKTQDTSWSADQVPVEKLIAPLVVLRLKENVRQSDIASWERRYGLIPPNSVVILDSGWSSKWRLEREIYLAYAGVQLSEFYPGFDYDACEYLQRKQVVGIGVDTMSIDGGEAEQNGKHPCQSYMADHNIYVLENLKDLHYLPNSGANVFVGMLKLVNGTGSPVTVLAFMNSGGSVIYNFWWMFISLSGFIFI